MDETRVESKAETELGAPVHTRDLPVKHRAQLPDKIYALFNRHGPKLRKKGLGGRLLGALVLGIVVAPPGVSAAEGPATEPRGVGVRRLEIVDPVGDRPMDAAVFYPSPVIGAAATIGSHDLAASRAAAVAEGRHPLLLVSHGNGGSAFGHHDIDSTLARHGWIVVAVTHPGDNARDASGAGATSTLYGRPLQISAALTAVRAAPFLEGRVDPRRVGFLGFSAGGGTGLILAGAEPAPARLEGYCARHPRRRGLCEAGGRIRDDRPDLRAQADPRIGAFVLLAPLSVFFPPESLARVTAPVFIAVGAEDAELDPTENALALARALPSPPRLEVLAGAGHYVFLSSCSDRLARAAPALCQDPPGVDRAALHARLGAEIAGFLGASLPPAR